MRQRKQEFQRHDRLQKQWVEWECEATQLAMNVEAEFPDKLTYLRPQPPLSLPSWRRSSLYTDRAGSSNDAGPQLPARGGRSRTFLKRVSS